MKIIKRTHLILTIASLLFFGNQIYGQGTYTNYCPNSGFDIKMILSIEYFDFKKNTTITKKLKSVSEIFENEELHYYSWAVYFERVKENPNCFRINFKKDFKNLLYDRKVKFITLKYYSGKDLLDEVTLTYDVKKKQSYSHIKNGPHGF